MKRGFTLIELILAFAIIGMLMTGVTLSLSAVLKSSARTVLQAKVRNEGEYLMESIAQPTRYATGVQCDIAGTWLTMSPKVSTDPDPKFTCSGSKLISGTSNQALNSDEIVISNCSFSCTDSAGNVNNTNPANVEITFSVSDLNGIAQTIAYDTNIVLRNQQ